MSTADNNPLSFRSKIKTTKEPSNTKIINTFLPTKSSPIKKSEQLNELHLEDQETIIIKKLYSPQNIQFSTTQEATTRHRTKTTIVKNKEIDKLIRDLTESSPNQKIYNNILNSIDHDVDFNIISKHISRKISIIVSPIYNIKGFRFLTF